MVATVPWATTAAAVKAVDSAGDGESAGLRPWTTTPRAGTPVAHTSPNPLDSSATPEGSPADLPTLTTAPLTG